MTEQFLFDKMETDEKMLVVRTKVAKEIVQTETSYIKALKTLVTVTITNCVTITQQ